MQMNYEIINNKYFHDNFIVTKFGLKKISVTQMEKKTRSEILMPTWFNNQL